MSFLRELIRILRFYTRRIYYAVTICLKDIYRLIEDMRWDRRLGIRTCYDDTDLEERAQYKDEVIYRPTSYHRIRKMIAYLKLGPDDVFVDFGSGKGRVLAMACQEPVKKVIGVEIQKRLADKALENVNKLEHKKAPVEVLRQDVTHFDPREGTVFFMYDPFRYQTFVSVLENIRRSLSAAPRNVRLVYFDERYADILNAQDWLKLDGEIGHTRIFVWSAKR